LGAAIHHQYRFPPGNAANHPKSSRFPRNHRNPRTKPPGNPTNLGGNHPNPGFQREIQLSGREIPRTLQPKRPFPGMSKSHPSFHPHFLLLNVHFLHPLTRLPHHLFQNPFQYRRLRPTHGVFGQSQFHGENGQIGGIQRLVSLSDTGYGCRLFPILRRAIL